MATIPMPTRRRPQPARARTPALATVVPFPGRTRRRTVSSRVRQLAAALALAAAALMVLAGLGAAVLLAGRRPEIAVPVALTFGTATAWPLVSRAWGPDSPRPRDDEHFDVFDE